MRFRFVPLSALVVALLGPIAAHAASPILALRDVFGRDVTTKGITLVDWEGFMANPATKYHFVPDPAASFPLRLTIRSNGHRINFDTGGPTGSFAGLDSATGNVFKSLTIPDASGADLYVSIYPDRDGANESYALTIQVADGKFVGYPNLTVPVNVIDYDKPDGPQGNVNIPIDYSRDLTTFFTNPDVRRLTEQAVADYRYFFDDAGWDPVAAGKERTIVFGHRLSETSIVTNSVGYTGFLLYFTGMDTEPEKRSTGNTQGALSSGGPYPFQSIGGVATTLHRSGVTSIYATGNFNDNGWYYSPLPASEDDWTHTYYSLDIPDYYSVVQHEMGHALGFNFNTPVYYAGRTTGLTSDRLIAYLGRTIMVGSSDHLDGVTDPASGMGAFGADYQTGVPIMKPGRFMICKTNLLVLEAVGWKLRRTSAFIPVTQDSPDVVTARVGAATTAQLSASYGIPPYNWTVASGSLPAGLALDSYGTISGTPTAVGVSTAQISVTDYDGHFDVRTVSFVVNAAAASAPAIVAGPASTTAPIGTEARFGVLATGNPAPTYQWLFNNAPIAGATSASYRIAEVTVANAGEYSVTITSSSGTITSPAATLTVDAAPVTPRIASAPQVTLQDDGTAALSVSATGGGLSYEWRLNGRPIAGANQATLPLTRAGSYSRTDRFSVVVTNRAGVALSADASVETTAPAIATQPASTSASLGGSASFSVATGGAGTALYQWRRNDTLVSSATGATLTLPSVQPADTGVYRALVSNGATTASSLAILGLDTTEKVVGAGTEVGRDIVFSNGNIFDQVLLEGAAATVKADPGQVVRISFLDLNNDIVQLEFSGAGSLSLVLDAVSGPQAPVNYNQATLYMKGHAGIVVTGADESTNLSVFSVGRGNAVNQSLFKSDVTYDGLADIAYIAILSPTGKFGGLRTANASYFATKGITGVYAPGVTFSGPVFIGDINARDTASPVILLGSAANTQINGGDLLQTNGRAVAVSGISQLKFVVGSTSHNTVADPHLLPAQNNKARLEQDGVDVTAQIVVNPTP